MQEIFKRQVRNFPKINSKRWKNILITVKNINARLYSKSLNTSLNQFCSKNPSFIPNNVLKMVCALNLELYQKFSIKR